MHRQQKVTDAVYAAAVGRCKADKRVGGGSSSGSGSGIGSGSFSPPSQANVVSVGGVGGGGAPSSRVQLVFRGSHGDTFTATFAGSGGDDDVVCASDVDVRCSPASGAPSFRVADDDADSSSHRFSTSATTGSFTANARARESNPNAGNHDGDVGGAGVSRGDVEEADFVERTRRE
jgi:hypothetical protein